MKPVIIIAIAFVLLIPFSAFAQESILDLTLREYFYILQNKLAYTVASGSMEPTMFKGDTIIIEKTPFEEIEIGDIIVYDRPSDHDKVIVHRVISIIYDEPKTIKTQGDANSAPIPGTDYPITEKEYLGKVVKIISDPQNEITINENEHTPSPRQWITSGPFQIDRSEYAIGEKIFLRINELKSTEKGQISVMRPLNSDYDIVYMTIPFDGSEKSSSNFYLEPKISSDQGIYSIDDLVGEWSIAFNGTNYANLNFEITKEVVPGTNTQSLIEPESQTTSMSNSKDNFYENQQYAFSIEYPKGWEIISDEFIKKSSSIEGINFEYVRFGLDSEWGGAYSSYLYPTIDVWLHSIRSSGWYGNSDQEHFDNIIKEKRKYNKGFSLLDSQITSIAGMKAFELSYSHTKPDGSTFLTIIPDGNDLWWITAEIPGGTAARTQIKQTIKDSIESFRSVNHPDIKEKLEKPSSWIKSNAKLLAEKEAEDAKLLAELEPTQENEIVCGKGTIEKNGQCVVDTKSSKGGGCLIATATYGSELSPQVQQLREIRDNSLLNTASGTQFMSTFNDFYYSFSPVIADYERENPVFKEMVKVAITPMMSSLSILNYVDMDSESSVLGYGISLIILNGLMYVGIPIAGIVVIRKRF